MAVYENQCGEGNCQCSFLFLDMRLASDWLNSATKYLQASLQLRGIDPVAILPWRLSTLTEHEYSFEKWCMIQLWIGLACTLLLFIVGLIWHATENLVPLGPVFTTTAWRMIQLVVCTWIMWFGVTQKKGCCCAITCCCLGKPNLLAVSIASGIIAFSTFVWCLEGIASGFALAIIGSLALLVLCAAQVLVTIEAFLIWRHSLSTSARDEETPAAPRVGWPVQIGKDHSAEEGPDLYSVEAVAPISAKVEKPLSASRDGSPAKIGEDDNIEQGSQAQVVVVVAPATFANNPVEP
jgi:hypothetical protein